MDHPVKRPIKFRFKKWINILAIAYLVLWLLLALCANWLPLGFSPTATNAGPSLQPPFQWNLYETNKSFHWLGTDELGRDFLAILVYGARTAFLVSFPAMLLAAVLGLGLGITAGFYGDAGIKWTTGKLSSFVISVLFFLFYAFSADIDLILPPIFKGKVLLLLLAIAVTGYFLYKLLALVLVRLPFAQRQVKIPLDLCLLKIIEIIGAVPRFLLILCLAAFLPPSVLIVVLLSMLTFWPGIARLSRAEILKQKNLPYIEAAVALGFTPTRVLLRHALPNLLVPVMVAVTFGICNLISLEATLSFLGVGVPVDTPSWGRAINGFRLNPGAWWLLLFPGLTIVLVVLALQNVNKSILKQLQPGSSNL